MNESKADKQYVVYSLNKIEIICTALYTMMVIGATFCIANYGIKLKLWRYLVLIIASIFGIGIIIKRAILDYKFFFSKEGFAIIKRNRITDKEIKTFYRWDEIQSMKLEYSIPGRRSQIYLIIKFKKKIREDKIEVTGVFQSSRFTKLARQYSGRENIIKDSKKRKQFQKDW